MKKLVKIFIGTALISTLCGCVVAPKKSSESIFSYEFAKPNICKKTRVNLKFLNVVTRGFTTTNYVDPDEKRGTQPTWASYYVIQELRKTDMLLFPENKTSENFQGKYLIEFQTHFSLQSNFFQQAWYWATIATLGILPSYGTGSIYVTALVKDDKGILIKEFKSSETNVNTWNGIFVLPFGLSGKYTEYDIGEKVFPKLTDEVLQKMIEDKLICDSTK